jgi:hypothetical protein
MKTNEITYFWNSDIGEGILCKEKQMENVLQSNFYRAKIFSYLSVWVAFLPYRNCIGVSKVQEFEV